MNDWSEKQRATFEALRDGIDWLYVDPDLDDEDGELGFLLVCVARRKLNRCLSLGKRRFELFRQMMPSAKVPSADEAIAHVLACSLLLTLSTKAQVAAERLEGDGFGPIGHLTHSRLQIVRAMRARVNEWFFYSYKMPGSVWNQQGN